MSITGSGSAVILLAEDDENHVLLFRRAVKKARLQCALQVVSDGEETLAYLKGEGPYANREEYPLPTLLLLDLKMPRKDGFEVLQWLYHQPTLSKLRVVVLTSSDQVWDVNLAYQLGASSFLTKPVHFQEFVAMLDAIQDFWIDKNRPPSASRPPTRKRKSRGES